MGDGGIQTTSQKLRRLAEIFGVTVEELLCGARKAGTADEISYAIGFLAREYRRAKTGFLAFVVAFFSSPFLLLLVLGIAWATGDIYGDWVIVPMALLALLHIAGEAGLIVYFFLMVKRKRIMYASFPNRTREVSALSNTIPPAKKTGKLGLIIVCGILLMLIAVMVILCSMKILSGSTASIVIGCVGMALGLGNTAFTKIQMNRITKNLNRCDYERAIKEGKFLLEIWLPDGRSVLCDGLRLDLAVAYYSLYDDENFRDYLGEITRVEYQFAKCYFTCMDALSQGDKEAFRTQYETVFLPLVEHEKKFQKPAAYYGNPLSLFLKIIEGNEPQNAKTELLALVTNPRTRDLIKNL